MKYIICDVLTKEKKEEEDAEDGDRSLRECQ